MPGLVERMVYLDNAVQLILSLASGHSLQALIQNTGDEIPYGPGAALQVPMPADALRVLTYTSEAAMPGQRPGCIMIECWNSDRNSSATVTRRVAVGCR